MNSVATTADGRAAITGSADGTARIWPLTIPAWTEHLCLRFALTEMWNDPNEHELHNWCVDQARDTIAANDRSVERMSPPSPTVDAGTDVVDAAAP